jgi:hypothetical protein
MRFAAHLSFVLALPLLASCAPEDATPYDADLYVAPGEIHCDTPDHTPPVPQVVPVLPAIDGIATDAPTFDEEYTGEDPLVEDAPADLLSADGKPIRVTVDAQL